MLPAGAVAKGANDLIVVSYGNVNMEITNEVYEARNLIKAYADKLSESDRATFTANLATYYANYGEPAVRKQIVEQGDIKLDEILASQKSGNAFMAPP